MATPRAAFFSSDWALYLGLLLAYASRATSFDLLVDDAFITFRYADHLAQGAGLVYNAGERVEGFSSILWTLLLAGGSALGVRPELSAPALGLVCGILTVGTVVGIARRLLGSAKAAVVMAAGALALNTSFGFWSASGMETTLFAWVLLGGWALGASTVPGDARGAACFGIAAGLLAWIRPEGVVLAALVPAYLAARRTGRGPILGGTLTAGGLVVGQVVARAAYYGTLVSNTTLAKAEITSAGIARGLEYAGRSLAGDGVVWVLPLVAYARFRRPGRIALAVLALIVTAMGVAVGGDGLYRYRLMVPVWPLVSVLAADGLDRLMLRGARWAAIGVGLALGAVVPPLLDNDFFRGFSLREVKSWEARWDEVGQLLRQRIPRDALLATNVAGRVPYRSELRTLDLLGLTDPVIARQPVGDFGVGYAGHERAAPNYVLSRRPDVLYASVLDGLPPELFCDPGTVRAVLASGSLFRYARMIDEDGFTQRYVPAQVGIGGDQAGGGADQRGLKQASFAGGEVNVFVSNELRKALSGRSGLAFGSWCGPNR